MLGLFLLLAAADGPPASTVRIHDGGMCAGLSWIRLNPGETVTADQGPDFTVFRFETKGADAAKTAWGVYSGNFAQVRGNGPLLLKRDGVAVHRAIEDGHFRGYLAEKKGWQNHFFGGVFSGTDADRAFFARVDFSAKGQALCGRPR